MYDDRDLESCTQCNRSFRGIEYPEVCPHCGFAWLEERERLEALDDLKVAGVITASKHFKETNNADR